MIGSTIVIINNVNHEVTDGNVLMVVAGSTVTLVLFVVVALELWDRWRNRK